MKWDQVTELSEELRPQGISLEKISHPSIHAKILAWDSNDAIISSLNWLSASAIGEDYDEIGIYLKAENIAEKITKEFYKGL